jgi:hypothetical protein
LPGAKLCTNIATAEPVALIIIDMHKQPPATDNTWFTACAIMAMIVYLIVAE